MIQRKLRALSIKQKVNLVLMLVCVTFLFTGFFGYIKLDNSISYWREMERDASLKLFLIHNIQVDIGYANGIHNFKNLVLRKDLKYAETAKKNFKAALSKIDEFLKLENVLENQKISLMNIKETVNQYLEKVDLATSLISKNSRVEQIDSMVKIDDSEASTALQKLNLSIQELVGLQRDKVSAKLVNGQIQISILWLSAFLILVYMIRSILDNLLNSVRNVADVASKVASGDFNASFDVSSKDEIGVVLHSLEKMKNSLLDTINNLEASNLQLEQYGHIVSHDLQEPIRKILAFGDRLSEDLGDSIGEDSRFYLDRILNSASRMRNLVDDLLTYAKLTNVKDQNMQSIDMEKLIKEVLVDLELSIEEASAVIRMQAFERVYGNRSEIFQLFENLIANALKFRKTEESIEIEIKQTYDTKNNRSHFRIVDNGIGFSQRFADMIMIPFHRLNRKEEYQGTGIGLAICKKIVSRHGGDLAAISKEGVGSEFYFSLPGDKS